MTLVILSAPAPRCSTRTPTMFPAQRVIGDADVIVTEQKVADTALRLQQETST